jgi:hypothetical protein
MSDRSGAFLHYLDVLSNDCAKSQSLILMQMDGESEAVCRLGVSHSALP